MQVELEAKFLDIDPEEIRGRLKDLGLDWSEALHGSVETAYQKYYDVSEQEIDSWELITFVPVPEWLEMRRRVSHK